MREDIQPAKGWLYRLLLDKSVLSKWMVAGCKFFMMLLSNITTKCV